jgi:hypothetical protein
MIRPILGKKIRKLSETYSMTITAESVLLEDAIGKV